MRTLWVVMMLSATVASASGTIVNTEPDTASEIRIQPSARVRLLQIDNELRALEFRVCAGDVFTRKFYSLTPWLTSSFLALGGIGGSNAVAAAIAAIVILLGVVLINVTVATVAVFEHWQNAARDADAHALRIRELRTERQQLELRM